eukprot:scaffold94102_cov31-Tisochrysis_lutea.AAC.2
MSRLSWAQLQTPPRGARPYTAMKILLVREGGGLEVIRAAALNDRRVARLQQILVELQGATYWLSTHTRAAGLCRLFRFFGQLLVGNFALFIDDGLDFWEEVLCQELGREDSSTLDRGLRGIKQCATRMKIGARRMPQG